MRRDLEIMADTKFDVLFVGGGVTGAAAVMDAAQRGLRAALVEKKDFGWATSSATSKLVHGGLRYLKNLEMGLVRESLRERRILERIAPHLVEPWPFLVPTYSSLKKNNLPMITAGMVLYELLSFDKAWLEDPDRQVPSFRLLSKRRVLEEEPHVITEGLTGGAIYYDCHMHSPERVHLEMIMAAAAHGAQVANYAEVVGLRKDGSRVIGATVRDAHTGEEVDISAAVVVNVAGPWADFVSEMALGGEKKHLIRSQGIHLIFRNITEKYALVLQTLSRRHFFLIPYRGMTLAGTTDTRFSGNPDQYSVTREAAEEFLREINEVYPSAHLTMDDVTWTYGGLRPIVDEETDVDVDVYKASRKYEIYDHADEDKVDGFVTVIGGKYTTSRNLAETLTNLVERKLGREPGTCHTAWTPLPGGAIRRWHEFMAEGRRRYPKLGEEMLQRLSLVYGTMREEVIGRMNENGLGAVVDSRHPLPAAVIVQAAEREMAMTLEDILWRRTTLGNTGQLSEEAVTTAGKIAGAVLGWSKSREKKEVQAALEKIAAKNMVAN
ncbi:MAG: glycerol-3-phosphate dehydrogenase/oxidase [Candidatus Lernaella stagnicola]|nr:glycerol-3-phosphate dehydrogenase/oxidase [Candidatus Lernaella stagnicola]